MREVLLAAGGEIIAISTESLERIKKARQENPDLPCLLASDMQAQAAEVMHLVHVHAGKLGKKIAIPANILLDSNGIVRWAHYAHIVMDRPDPDEVLHNAQALTIAARSA